MTTSIVSIDAATSKLQVGGADAFSFKANGVMEGITSINGGSLSGMRNRFHNGDMRVAQRPNVGLVSNYIGYAGADRWLLYAQGTATVGSAGQYGNALFSSGFAQGFGNATGNFIPNVIQRVESINCADLNNKIVTISGKIYQDTGSTVLCIISLDGATAKDNFAAATPIGASPISVPSGVATPFSATFTLGSTAANNGLAVTVKASTSISFTGGKTFLVGDAQFENSPIATMFEWRDYGDELRRCQRYLPTWQVVPSTYQYSGQCFSTSLAVVTLPYPVTPRAPVTSISNTQSIQVSTAGGTLTGSGALSLHGSGLSGITVAPVSATGLVAGNATTLIATATVSTIFGNGCEL